VRGPWNQGQGPWPEGMEWECVEKPAEQWLRSDARQNKGEERSPEGQSAVQSEKPFTHEQHTATS
jgi:Mn-containing catalase